MEYDTIVVGAGVAGCVIAGELARRGGQSVLVIDERDHIAGNCYDEYDEYGIMVHVYGPHIFHTEFERVYEYLSQYTEWYEFGHEVHANVHGNIINVPFNLNTLHAVYDEEKAARLEDKLVKEYGFDSRVPILTLKENPDEEIREVAQYVYDNIFLKYTMKQWGKKPEEIDPNVTARVPVVISRDNRYFKDKYQGMPLQGYTAMFEKILDHENIHVQLSTPASEILEFKDDKIYYDGDEFTGKVIYTGLADGLFNYEFGHLPYRSLRFKFEHYKKESFQGCSVVNYTVDEDYTRITEFKYLTGQVNTPETTIVKEYPESYDGSNTPYYSINNPENDGVYAKYKEKADRFKNLYLLGRLAEYKYYNIDAIALRSLELADKLIGQ